MTGRLLVVAAALALAAPASAAGPAVDARAWLVENGDSGEVLAHFHERQQRPIASLTKLMTVELTLRHARPTDVFVVDPRAASVGESSAHLEGGERLTVRDLLEAALIARARHSRAPARSAGTAGRWRRRAPLLRVRIGAAAAPI